MSMIDDEEEVEDEIGRSHSICCCSPLPSSLLLLEKPMPCFLPCFL